MQKILPLEYISNLESSIPQKFVRRSCGVICVGMILKTKNKSFGTLGELIEEGKSIHAYIEGIGWRHKGLVELLSKYNISAYLQEYRKKETKNTSIFEIDGDFEKDFVNKINRGNRIIVSVASGFDTNKSSHLVVVHGYEIEIEGEVVSWLISDSSNSKYKKEWVTAKYFRDFFRGLSIIAE